MRGKKTASKEGKILYELDDAFTIFEVVRNTKILAKSKIRYDSQT